MTTYTDDEVHHLAGVITDARLAGVAAGSWTLARMILDAGFGNVEQLRYERRLLGVARMTLDLVAAGDVVRWEQLRPEAGEVAQRIVDEIGHPVTDEPALGPDMRVQLAQMRAALDEANGRAADVAGAVANLLRATERTDPGYEKLREAYGVALEAAGLVSEETR